MSRRFRPYRRFRNELVSLALAAIVPFILLAVFPRAALKPLPAVVETLAEASCAFVTLTPDEERRALAAARAAWQIDRDGVRRVRMDLFADSLPTFPQRAIFDMPPVAGNGCRTVAPYVPDPLPPTLAAPPPATIVPQPDADPPTFSREEMLAID